MNLLKHALPLRLSYRYVRDIAKRLGLSEFYRRRMEIGPEKQRHRSEFLNWNYDSEIFAFGKRLKENFQEDVLRQAFIDKSYLTRVNNPNIPDNSELKNYGYELASKYTRAFLVHVFPHLPCEWIDQIYNHLLSVQTIAHVSGHIGTKDLILSDSVQVDLQTESNVLFAIIGALAKSQNEKIAHVFIKDFILTQLTAIHLCDLIQVDKPLDLLRGLLLYYKKALPETRLLRQSAMNSVFACYHVGVYSDDQMIGQAAGDTIKSAENMAVIQSLFNLFGIPENRANIDFKAEFDIDFDKNPISIDEYLKCLV